VLVIRHASAGDSAKWEGDDRLRPLDATGFAQARQLVERLDGYAVSRVLSSPAVRCIQTVEPLARKYGLEIELCEELAEQRQEGDGAKLVRSLVGEDAAVCVHGGLAEAAFGESQKKAEVLVVGDDGQVAERLRA
jgi:phosphohistidine phosphatase SixA